MSKQSVLLTGASGTVGIEVLEQLIDQQKKYKLTVFDKKNADSVQKLEPFKGKAKIIYGDITREEDVAKIATNQDVIIHLAAIIPPLADDNPDLAQSVNTTGTQILIQKLEELSPKAFLIYSSSISVYGDRLKDPYIKVGDDLKPSKGDKYALTKIASEKLIQESTLNWTIFRLAAIMGGHKMSRLMFHQPLDTSLEIATPRDTARAFVNAIPKESVLTHKIFNLGGGESCRISYRDFLTRSFEIYGLEEFNFPEKAFAEKNFHCGFYEDGDDLEEIVHFRNDSLEDYFNMEKSNFSTFKKFGATLFKAPIKWYLLKQSEPYQAIKTENQEMKKQFFIQT